MKILLAAILLVGLCLDAKAQGSQIIMKNKAKATRDANNNGAPPPGARPGGAGGAAPGAAPAHTGPVASATSVTTTVTASIAKIQANIATIKTKPEASDEQKQKFGTDMLAAAAGVKPTEEAVRKLADSLATAIANTKIASGDQSKLARDLYSLLNSSTSPAQVPALIDDAKEILLVAGVAKGATQTVGKDLNAVAASMQGTPAPTAAK